MKFLRDEDFIRGEIPMTKGDIRILTLSRLKISPGMTCLDIGAGTGSVSIEMGRMGGVVTSVEKRPEAVELIKGNSQFQDVKVNIIEGTAPGDLPDQMWDRIFIGGSNGKLKELLQYSYDHLNPGGKLVINCIIISNAVISYDFMKHHFTSASMTLVSIANTNQYGMMIGDNPIYILEATKL